MSTETRLEPTLAQTLHMVNGDTIQGKLSRSTLIADLLKAKAEPDAIIGELYDAHAEPEALGAGDAAHARPGCRTHGRSRRVRGHLLGAAELARSFRLTTDATSADSHR